MGSSVRLAQLPLQSIGGSMSCSSGEVRSREVVDS